MGVIHRLRDVMPSRRLLVPVPIRESGFQRIHDSNPLPQLWIIVGLLVCGMGLPTSAWSDDPSGFQHVKFETTHVSMPVAQASSRPTVAAGFGFQNAESSTITVKTYDALTGEILSDESYDLNVKEEEASSSRQPRERIFAGGVGVGMDGLSDFTLRVYDAATGKFLWEGRLNLSVNNNEVDSTHRIVAHLQPKPAVRTVRGLERMSGRPSFLLRAIDPVTGQLVWADQFSTGHGSMPRIERIKASFADLTEDPATLSKSFDFRIRMFDDQDREMLWEDTIVPHDEAADLSLGRESQADKLPAWSGSHEGMRNDAVRFENRLHSAEGILQSTL